MPLTSYEINEDDLQLGIWQISEPESYFLEAMGLSIEENLELNRMQGQRRLHWLASRIIFKSFDVGDDRYKIIKDNYGKPYLINTIGHISISHSHDHAAAIFSKSRPVGIDIQKMVDKIERIAPKFMSEHEMNELDSANKLEALHIYWSAKESLYKAYGRKKVDFRNHIRINSFEFVKEGSTISGYLNKPDYAARYNIHYKKYKDYILVHAFELDENP